jgi:hypothetical protein
MKKEPTAKCKGLKINAFDEKIGNLRMQEAHNKDIQ